MPEQEPPKRSGDLDLTTLAIAAAASAAAAYVTSQVWAAGTLWSAAMTPVIVALVKEGLARPADKIYTVRQTVVGGGGKEADVPTEMDEPEVAVYGRPNFGRRWRIAVATGLLAFAAVVALYTVPELIAGNSVGRGGDGGTTLFGGKSRSERNSEKNSNQNESATPAPDTQDEPAEEATPTPTETPAEATVTPTATATATPTPLGGAPQVATPTAVP